MNIRMRQILLCSLWWCAGVLAFAASEQSTGVLDLATRFDQCFAQWQAWCAMRGETGLLTVGAEFDNLVELGPLAAPQFAMRMKQATTPREGAALAEALSRVTGKVFPRKAWPEGKYFDPAARVALFTQWWTIDRANTRAEFERVYTRWKELKAKGDLLMTYDSITISYDDTQKMVVTKKEQKRTELMQVYTDLKNMGLDLLPLIVEKLQAKDYDLLPLFSELANYGGRNASPPDARAKSMLLWWDNNKERLVIPAG